MANLSSVCYAILALLGASQALQLVTRDVDIAGVTKFQSALLLIDGKQTTCESVLVDSNAGFVAASCLKYTSDGDVDTDVKYELAVRAGGSTTTEVYPITQIDSHKEYNPETYVNNLAVIQFNPDKEVTWQNYIGIDPEEWDDHYFIRRSLSSVSSLTWNNIIAFANTDTPIYAAVQPSDMSIVALHSHSAVYGDTMCSKSRKLHYYIVLRNYIGWAAGILGRSVGGFAKDSSFEFTPVQGYQMKDVSTDDVEDVTLFSGDQYSQNPIDPKIAEAEPETKAETANEPVSSDEPVSSSELASESTSESTSESSSESSSELASESSSGSSQPVSQVETKSTSDTDSTSELSSSASPSSSLEPTEPTVNAVSNQSDTSSSEPSSLSESSLDTSSSSETPSESPSPSSNDPQEDLTSNSEIFDLENLDGDDPEENGQSILFDIDSKNTIEPDSSSTPGGGNYVDYQVNSNGDVSSSVIDEPNNAIGSNSVAQNGVNSNQLVVIIVLVIGGIALVCTGIAWYVIRRKKQAARRQNNWDARESMKPLPNSMRMTADLAQDINYDRETANFRRTTAAATAADNGWRATNYTQEPKAYPRDTTYTAWTVNNNQTTTDDIVSQYYGQQPPYEGNYRH
ncbi:hypothetical protein GGH14_002551 [Coemansia sp. RSA 370]|nr:hypothetical protein IW144_000561 [Coemansia sp. RSA 522]KAJ2279942.1 hypothetical protein GGH14_002551 [Coemansia sp. RSA 370]